MSKLKLLKWNDESGVDVKHTAQSLLHDYTIQHCETGKKFEVEYKARLSKEKPSPLPATGFLTVDAAKAWAWAHYNERMESYLRDDTAVDYFAKFAKWSRDRKIIQNGSILAQGLKLGSEKGELDDNLAKGRCIKDDIGDCLVVLNNLALMSGLTIEECMAQAWNDIKDRKGTMNEHGVFIKEDDEADNDQ